MADRDPIWDALKERSQGKFDADRDRFLQQAQADDDGGWTKHTEFHWSRMVNGDRLDYWPSRKKFQYRGRVSRGLRAMYGIIRAAAGVSACPSMDECQRGSPLHCMKNGCRNAGVDVDRGGER